METPLAFLVAVPDYRQWASSGPGGEFEAELRQIFERWEPGSKGAEWIEDARSDRRFSQLGGSLRFLAAAPVQDDAGHCWAVLVVAHPNPRLLDARRLEQLSDLAALSFSLRDTGQQQAFSSVAGGPEHLLLEKSIELAKFGDDLLQIHRLTTTEYESFERLLEDYLATGCTIFDLGFGAVIQVRGRYAVLRAVCSNSASPRAGMTFDLSRVFCGAVVEQQRTIAHTGLKAQADVFDRPHYGPARPDCYIGAPVLLDGEVWGVLSFCSPSSRRREFSRHEIELVELMANGIARAVLEGKMKAARERADALERDRSEILEMVAKNRSLGMVLSKIAQMVERQEPALAVAVLVMQEGKLHCMAAPSLPEQYFRRMQNLLLPRQMGCCLSAAYTCRTEILEPQTSLPPASCCKEFCMPEFCWQACGASPILSASGELLGLVAAYWRLAVRPWHLDPALLEMACRLAALALEHRALTDRLAYQAQHDSLTGLVNRAVLARTLEQRLSKRATTAVAFVDIDRFKKINDHLGHRAGDQVLCSVAARLAASLRGDEVVARFGGDEFVVLLHHFADEQEAYRRVLAMLEDLRKPIVFGEHKIWVTASVGLSFYPQAGVTAEALLGGADMAMYRVKNSGRNNVKLFAPGLDDQHLAKLELEHSMRQAIERNEFQTLFQPIFRISSFGPQTSEQLVGFEVLLEWQRPKLGRVPAAQFIPIAEESGMIDALGAWALRRACRQAAVWRKEGLPPICVSVNVSALQFARPDFVETVLRTLQEHEIPGTWLQLELTESALVRDATEARTKLERLRASGVRIALDDFGTGYSSLGYLRSLPVDCVKIDRSFLMEVETSPHALSMIEMIVTLAHNMGLTVVAEGVETERQLALLKKARCDMAQGHYLSRALDVEGARQRITS